MIKIININQKLLYILFINWLKYLFIIRKVNNNGIDNQKNQGRLVIISNHVSMWDAFLIFSALGPMFFLSKLWRIPASYEFFKKNFLLSIFLKSIGLYPLTARGELGKSLIDTIRIIENNYSILYFPEGKRIKNDQKGIPRRGIGYLVKTIPVNLLPVYIEYPKRFKPWGANIIFGEIISNDLVKNFDSCNSHEKIMDFVWGLKK